MKSLSIMLKPASSNCNLRCKYCFYNNIADNRLTQSYGYMSTDTLEEVLRKAFDYIDGGKLMLAFQGGEPLLAGKDFFIFLKEQIANLNTKNSEVFIGIQTNGTLIDDEWCEIFKQSNYLVGLSLDGDEMANSLRIDHNLEPTFQTVIKSAKLMQQHAVDFNILCVLTKQVAARITEIYKFYQQNNFKFLQFIPMLKPFNLDENGYILKTPTFKQPFPSKEDNYSLSGKDYELFLKKCFNLYLNDFINSRYTSIRTFDNFAKLAQGLSAEQCGMNGHCAHQFVIEASGEIYPCDFYCLDQYLLGNIQSTNFDELIIHPIALKFIKESIDLSQKCKKCNYYALCRNGCKRERIDIDKCDALKSFFQYALPHLQRMS